MLSRTIPRETRNIMHISVIIMHINNIYIYIYIYIYAINIDLVDAYLVLIIRLNRHNRYNSIVITNKQYLMVSNW
jgi:hypothetical protein